MSISLAIHHRLLIMLALSASLLPLTAIHLSWWLSSGAELIPHCNPYTQGCTTISAAGRAGQAFYLFKALMMPAAVVFALYWMALAVWLRLQLQARITAIALMWLGGIAASFLTLYTVYLGSDVAAFRIYRRVGASCFFGASFLAEVLASAAIWRQRALIPGILPCLLLGLVLAQLALGLGSLPITLLTEDPFKDAWENRIEWQFTLLMMLFPAATIPLLARLRVSVGLRDDQRPETSS